MKKHKRQTISVTLATYNEESVLSGCLDSVKDFADEIIMVDGHSQDRTVAIAKEYGAQVFLRENNPIFHVQKQIANDQAKSDWILQMDADERVTPELKREIIRILEDKSFGFSTWISPLKRSVNKIIKLFPEPEKLSEAAAAYWLPRKNFFLKGYLKNTGQYPDPVIRLFQKGMAYLPAKDVHEQMVVKGNIGWLKSDLDHYATPDFGRYLLRENRYSSLAASQLKAAGVRVHFFNTIKYLLLKPASTFLNLYFRRRGFLDGFPGFIFSLYSGLHHAFSYMKLWELYKSDDFSQSDS